MAALDGVFFEVKGLEEAQRALDTLSADMRRKVVYGALRDAGKPVAQVARALAQPRDFGSARRVAGTMRRAIGVFRSKRYKAAQGALGVYISVRASRAQRRRAPVSGDPFYFRFVEGGHQPRPGKSHASKRKAAAARVRAYPFIGPAFQQKGDDALRIFQERILERVAQANKAKPD